LEDRILEPLPSKKAVVEYSKINTAMLDKIFGTEDDELVRDGEVFGEWLRQNLKTEKREVIMSLSFCYKTKTEKGEDKNGVIEASDEKDAVKQLQAQGLYVISISPASMCPKCGKKYDSSAWKTCLDCGVALEKEGVLNKTLPQPNAIDAKTSMLTKCKTCSKEVSVNAATCPHCGEDLSVARVKCPRCGSTNITSAKKGFDGGMAFGGFVLAGLWGTLLGLADRNAIMLYCEVCGCRWDPVLMNIRKRNENKTASIVFGIILFSIAIGLIVSMPFWVRGDGWIYEVMIVLLFSSFLIGIGIMCFK